MQRFSHLIKGNQLDRKLIEAIAKLIYYSTGLFVTVKNESHQSLFNVGFSTPAEEILEGTTEDYAQFIKAIPLNQSSLISVFTAEDDIAYFVVPILDHANLIGSLCLGPFVFQAVDEHMINRILSKDGFSIYQREMVKQVYGSLPVVGTARSYYLQQMILGLLTNTELQSLLPKEAPTTNSDRADSIPIIDPNTDFDQPEYNYALELLFLTKVKNGDIQKVIELFNEHIRPQFQNSTTPNPLRYGKNRGLSFSTLLSRTIVEGGVDANKALSIEFHYAEIIENTHNLNELIDILEQMLMRYTNTVLQLSSINHVSVIKNASKYVHMHLSEAIRLNDVANFVNLSPNYFSSLFKREMKLSFADYVNQTRIKESQFLLETTEYPILDIAISVGYNNQNYFTTIFRKFTGITPKQYRMRSAK